MFVQGWAATVALNQIITEITEHSVIEGLNCLLTYI
jgi:hypothetical protein